MRIVKNFYLLTAIRFLKANNSFNNIKKLIDTLYHEYYTYGRQMTLPDKYYRFIECYDSLTYYKLRDKYFEIIKEKYIQDWTEILKNNRFFKQEEFYNAVKYNSIASYIIRDLKEKDLGKLYRKFRGKFMNDVMENFDNIMEKKNDKIQS